MDLESQPVQQTPERPAENNQSYEARPGLPTSPERPPVESESSSVEREPAAMAGQAAADMAMAASAAQPAVPMVGSDVGTAAATDDDLPLLASDDDLIEKEWVDKAKSVINETKDDPSRQEKEIAKLQVDYLKKRYGKELGSAEHD